MTTTSQFFELSEAESRALLARNRIGRLAYIAHGRADIQPVGYVAKGEWLFVRSAYGAKVKALEHNPYVAFEVDEVRGPFEWESCVVHGTCYVLPPDGGAVERSMFAMAVEALREVMPQALAAGDPFPERDIVYGIRIDRMVGRMATHAHPGGERTPIGPRVDRRAGRRSTGF